MRILVITDVHANLEALDAVLGDAGEFDVLWSLGDVVGYGPEPNECIERIKDLNHVAIPGNHDWGVLGKLDLEDFNEDARRANLWTREQLCPGARSYLQALEQTAVVGDYTLAHGSPRHPIWEYIFYPSSAETSLRYFDTPICLVGHTHVPAIFRDPGEGAAVQVISPPISRPVRLDEARYIINPGSVGQPRDADPRAAYLLLDTEENMLEHRRVSYDVSATQRKMRALGMSPRLAARLEFGW